MASSNSNFNISSNLVISHIVLSSTKLARLAFFMNENKSFMNKFNSIGPNIEPCGTPETNILIDFYILTFRFLLFE